MCVKGLENQGNTGVNVDMCASKSGVCSPFATCTNVPGSFKCTCKPGFKGTGFTCKGKW